MSLSPNKPKKTVFLALQFSQLDVPQYLWPLSTWLKKIVQNSLVAEHLHTHTPSVSMLPIWHIRLTTGRQDPGAQKPKKNLLVTYVTYEKKSCLRSQS